MLADELDSYKRRGNTYVDRNIKEIQELYKEEEREQKKMKKRSTEQEGSILMQTIQGTNKT